MNDDGGVLLIASKNYSVQMLETARQMKFKNIIDQRLFIPAGRIISGAGVDKKLTLSNCFTMNFVPDSMDEIFNFVKYGALVHKQGGK